MNIAAILQLLNLAIPAVTNLVLLIKDSSGSTTAIISSTQQANAQDIAQIQAWLQAHQTQPAAGAANPATAPSSQS